MDPGPAGTASPTDLLERQILWDHQRSCKVWLLQMKIAVF